MALNSQLRNVQNELNHWAPAARDAKLGDLLVALITNHNQLVTDHNALVTKYNALLAHLDTGNVTGIGSANAATYGGSASTATDPALGSL